MSALAPGYRGYMSRARVYRAAFRDLPAAVLNYRETPLSWGSLSHYCVDRKVGRGRYGEVFHGFHRASGRECTVKVLKPVKMKHKFEREVAVLRTLHGAPHVPTLLDVVRDAESGTAALVFEWREADALRDVVVKATDQDLRHLMRQLLVALDAAHSRAVMHRDVKPNNFLVDLARRELTLVDWGLADFYVPCSPYNCRVATKAFKAPELLLGMRHYDYSTDMWSFGVTMASILFRRLPFFGTHSARRNAADPIADHVRLLGSASLLRYLRKFGLQLTDEQRKQVRPASRLNWGVLVNDDNRHLVSEEAVDLVSRLIRFDHTRRLTAQEALAHPYFDPVR